jgi:hypothetical protein
VSTQREVERQKPRSYRVANKSKQRPLLDWHGKVVSGVIVHTVKNSKFKIRTDENGKDYWLNEGERDYELPFLKVSERKENGAFEIVYDSRCCPPHSAKV